MKNLKFTECLLLTETEIQQINGGETKSSDGFWDDIMFTGGSIVNGLIAFSTQGGRNAGLTVR